MSIRDDIFARFGPLLLEALVDTVLLEVNELRTKAGLPPKNKTEILTSTISRMSEQPEYDWMSNRE